VLVFARIARRRGLSFRARLRAVHYRMGKRRSGTDSLRGEIQASAGALNRGAVQARASIGGMKRGWTGEPEILCTVFQQFSLGNDVAQRKPKGWHSPQGGHPASAPPGSRRNCRLRFEGAVETTARVFWRDCNLQGSINCVVYLPALFVCFVL